MISNQIIQTSIDELKAITKVDIYVFDLDGIKVAVTTEDIEISREIITGFAASPADSQVVGGYHFLKVLASRCATWNVSCERLTRCGSISGASNGVMVLPSNISLPFL